jgi:hypothetical protein
MELLVLITPRGYDTGVVAEPAPADQAELVERARTMAEAAEAR